MVYPRPTVGRIVLYTITDDQAMTINRRRYNALHTLITHRERGEGAMTYQGNTATGGDVYPMIITRLWGTLPDSPVNGSVFLDGNDVLWVTSTQVGVGPGTYAWPVVH